MKLSARNIVVAVIAVTLVIWIFVFVRHQQRKPSPADVLLKDAYDMQAKFRANIDKDLATLKRESLAQSLANMSDLSIYLALGPRVPGDFILDGNWAALVQKVSGQNLESLMCNRRFRKVLVELSKMDKAGASELVNRELSAVLSEYLPRYDAALDWFMKLADPHYVQKTNTHILEPGFGTVVTGDVGTVTMIGTKNKVLALVWLAGMLELNGCKDQVERVARLSVRQRTELSNTILGNTYQLHMVENASIYHPMIISSGLLGVQANRDLEARILKAAGAEWQETKLAMYTAAMTEYDFYTRRVGKTDYSRGTITVKYVGPVNEASFDMLLRELHLIP